MTELTLNPVHEPQLPPMAWLVTIDWPTATVHHGSRVEVWDRGFFEGAYAGRWIDDDPSQCAEVFGSGMVMSESAFHIVTPSHTSEAVFVSQHDGTSIASNSLAYLVEWLNLDVPLCYQYSHRFASLMRGIHRYKKRVIESGGKHIDRYIHQNLEVNRDGVPRRRDKPVEHGFTTYEGYISHLDSILDAIFSNAVDERRQCRYDPISTVSSGYDSSFVTAIASRSGLREAISVSTDRKGESDSGEEIVRRFGVSTTVVPAKTYEEATLNELAEFGVSGLGVEDYAYSAMTSHLTGRMLLTGDPAPAMQLFGKPNRELVRYGWSTTGLQEHRLRMGFIVVPVLTIAIPHQHELYRIARTEEFAPYWIPGKYNAPISRRFLENHGVPREAFGQDKRAIALLFFNRPGFRSHLAFRNLHLSDAARNDVIVRAKSIGADPLGGLYRRHVAQWVVSWEALRRIGGFTTAMRRASQGSPRVLSEGIAAVDSRIQDIWRLYVVRQPILSLFFLVSLDIVRERYQLPNVASNKSATVVN